MSIFCQYTGIIVTILFENQQFSDEHIASDLLLDGLCAVWYGMSLMSWIQFYFVCETGQIVEVARSHFVCFKNVAIFNTNKNY